MKKFFSANQPFRRAKPKVGRNDTCPCGSGKKYKKSYKTDESTSEV